MSEITEGRYSTKQSRKKYIDAVKGFCIILVVISHAGGIPIIGGLLTACYMQVYFFLGGITYKEKYKETFAMFAKKKAKRLLLPYFSYAGILLLMDAIINHLSISEVLIGGGVFCMPGIVSLFIMAMRTTSFCLII